MAHVHRRPVWPSIRGAHVQMVSAAGHSRHAWAVADRAREAGDGA
jgi:hypothetical protein